MGFNQSRDGLGFQWMGRRSLVVEFMEFGIGEFGVTGNRCCFGVSGVGMDNWDYPK